MTKKSANETITEWKRLNKYVNSKHAKRKNKQTRKNVALRIYKNQRKWMEKQYGKYGHRCLDVKSLSFQFPPLLFTLIVTTLALCGFNFFSFVLGSPTKLWFLRSSPNEGKFFFSPNWQWYRNLIGQFATVDKSTDYAAGVNVSRGSVSRTEWIVLLW